METMESRLVSDLKFSKQKLMLPKGNRDVRIDMEQPPAEETTASVGDSDDEVQSIECCRGYGPIYPTTERNGYYRNNVLSIVVTIIIIMIVGYVIYKYKYKSTHFF